jgi:hypothetical protein
MRLVRVRKRGDVREEERKEGNNYGRKKDVERERSEDKNDLNGQTNSEGKLERR